MASYFWVGGTGTWDTTTTTNWATSSGGAGSAGVPTSADNVTFDASSGSGTCTINAGVCFNLDLSLSSLTTFSFTAAWKIYGTTVKMKSGFTFTGQCQINLFTASATCLLTTNGHNCQGGIVCNSTGVTLSLQDDVTDPNSSDNITMGTNDDLTTNNHNITIGGFSASGGAGTVLTLGSSTITLTGTIGWTVNAGATVTAGTSTIKFTNNSSSNITFAGAGKTYNVLYFNRGALATGANIITGANTFNTLRDDTPAAHNLQLPASTTQTITGTGSSLQLIGASAVKRLSLVSGTGGTKATISAGASTTVIANYINLTDQTATGGATFNATHVGTATNQTGWNVTLGSGVIAKGGNMPMMGM